MRRVFLVFFLFVFSILLSGCSLPFSKEKQAALQVTANPKTTIFLNGEHIGSSPFFDEKIKPGDYRIKLVPEASGQQVLSWEGQVKLVGGVLTVISRDLGESEDKSSGYVLSLEPKVDKNTASVAVVTVPDGAVVSLDGEPKGFAPLNVDSVAEGEHTLVISSPGYVEKSIKAKVVKGYKLTASVQLAKMPPEPEPESTEATASATPTPSPSASKKPTATATPRSSPTEESDQDTGIARPYVLIKSPDTGWVRVREEPNTTSQELAKINDGEKYKYLDTSAGWYKIEYETGKEGWISGKYAELFK
jgi:hypothetical protein